MVCHETYKDSSGNWISPDEIETIDGKKYLKNKKEKILIGPSESMSKSKKNTIDPENIISNFGADAAGYLFYQIVLQKRCSMVEEGIISSFKFIQKLWNLHLKILLKIKTNHSTDADDDLNIQINF